MKVGHRFNWPEFSILLSFKALIGIILLMEWQRNLRVRSFDPYYESAPSHPGEYSLMEHLQAYITPAAGLYPWISWISVGLAVAGLPFLWHLFRKPAVPPKKAQSLHRRWRWWNVTGAYLQTNLLCQLFIMGVFSIFYLSIRKDDDGWRLHDSILPWLSQGLIVLLMAAPCYVMIRSLSPGFRSMAGYFRFRKTDFLTNQTLKLTLAALCLDFLLSHVAFYTAWSLTRSVPSSEMDTHVFGAFFLATLFVACIVAPFAEELIFRGFLYSGLKTRFSPIPAAVIVSLLFSYSHGYGLYSSVVVFCTGLVLTLLREKSGGLAAPMLCHACINLTVYLQTLR